ncbi:NUDIX hydrolase [Clostridiisalibacter paucivorans]|uniref:NUDIX hydrolase n=1 Tax=Clostridiisalibacter paucivorans TaxID=408753 RepID=UPI000479299C|nr:NUDIX hydrolase [Clostridiisalibacter paucivorans]
MAHIEKTMKSEKIYEGKIVNLRIDTVELPDKKYSKREIVEHPGAVAIIAVNEKNELIMVKQYRKAVEDELYEIPAGKIEIGEDPKSCAIRELKEETGYTPENIDYILEFFTSPGFSNEKLYLFMATGLNEGEATPDIDEYIDVVKLKIEDLLTMIEEGKILDSKTIIAILLAKKFACEKE